MLDEIDVLDLKQQVKLLRVIETGEYELVGSTETHISEARLIVASNVNLDELVASGQFRSDLFYRLNVLEFCLPALRHRPLDSRTYTLEMVGEITRNQRRASGHHPAPDIDTNGGRDDSTLSRNDRTNGRSNSHMDIGHRRNMFEDEGHPRRTSELISRLVVHGNAPGPHLDRLAPFDVGEFVRRLYHLRFQSSARPLGVAGLFRPPRPRCRTGAPPP